jgi:hypothetical protein
MPVAWTHFLAVRLPLAALGLAAICQVMAAALAHVPMRRTQVDELALAVLDDDRYHRIVLFGDSTTHMATRVYSVGDDVADLSTQAYVGPWGDVVLLKRYLERHKPPRHVVISFVEDDFQEGGDIDKIRYFDWYTFDRPDEHALLTRYVKGIDAREGYPAIMDPQIHILERIVSLMRRGLPQIPVAPRQPDASAPLENDDQSAPEVRLARANARFALGAAQKAALADLCRMSVRYGFRLDLALGPVHAEIRQARLATGTTEAVIGSLKTIVGQDCNAGPIFDFNDVRRYTNFNRDSVHLRGDGWYQRFASDLRDYLAALP